MSKSPTDPGRVNRLDRALRLIFHRDGSTVKLASVQRLKMTPPPPQALVPTRPSRGSWFELRDGNDTAVYRRVIQDPLADLEVVMDDPAQSLRRVSFDGQKGAFFLIVPDIAGVRRLALLSESQTRGQAKAQQRSVREGEGSEPLPQIFDLSQSDGEED